MQLNAPDIMSFNGETSAICVGGKAKGTRYLQAELGGGGGGAASSSCDIMDAATSEGLLNSAPLTPAQAA